MNKKKLGAIYNLISSLGEKDDIFNLSTAILRYISLDEVHDFGDERLNDALDEIITLLNEDEKEKR